MSDRKIYTCGEIEKSHRNMYLKVTYLVQCVTFHISTGMDYVSRIYVSVGTADIDERAQNPGIHGVLGI